MKYQCEEKRFLKDIESHQMIVLRNDGLYRHIRFKRPSDSHMYFDFITWAGHLCYTGDMGTYVFSRLEDMFEFFRMDNRDFNYSKERALQINPGYWSEKLQGYSHHRHGSMEFSEDKFRAAIKSDFDNHFENKKPDDDASDEEKAAFEEKKADAWEEIEGQILQCDDLEHEGMRAVYSFEHDGLDFKDFWDHSFEDFTFHFVWCCYALAWGIAKYDEATQQNKAEVSGE